MSESEKLPIVFIHRGYARYLHGAIAQARHSNPRSPVYLIGDATNEKIPGVLHRRFADFQEGAAQFASLYRHFSDNPYDFELFCYQRWFILREVMEREGLPCAFYCDSDVMVYSDLSRLSAGLPRDRLSLSCPDGLCPSGHVCGIGSQASLASLCEFLIRMYTEAELLAGVEEQYRLCQEKGIYGGSCDMTAIRDYKSLGYGTFHSITAAADGGYFDDNINDCSEYVPSPRGIKQVYWNDGKPYCRFRKTGELRQFHTLHFQGGAKAHLLEHYTGRDPAVMLYAKQAAFRAHWMALKSMAKRLLNLQEPGRAA